MGCDGTDQHCSWGMGICGDLRCIEGRVARMRLGYGRKVIKRQIGSDSADTAGSSVSSAIDIKRCFEFQK
jgi:hypothetical protein